MTRSWKWILTAILVTGGLVIGLSAGALDAQQKNVLVAKKVSAPPPMEPAMGDAWKDAQPLTVKVVGGMNLPGGSTEVTLRESVRTGSVGHIDDQWLDATRYDKDKAPEAGRKSDPKTGGGYSDNVSDDKKGPKWALKGNKPAPPYWIVDAEKEPFDDSKYKAGDEVPGMVVAP